MVLVDHQILALAAFLQSQLEILVVTAEFFPGRSHDASDTPSSLITVEPFSPGGLRRLALNVHSSLVQTAARALSKGCEHAVRELGEAMVLSGSWPVQHMDGSSNVHWKTARGLIATPHVNCVWPVPHQEFAERRRVAVAILHTPLVIWPRRICKVTYKINRGLGAAPGKQEYELQYVSEVWSRRDRALYLEYDFLVQQEKRVGVFSRSKRRLLQKQQQDNAKAVVGPHSALLTHAPSLPVFCIADIFVRHGMVPRHSSLAEASEWLVQHDRLFGLGLFFGVPLMDRTGVLHGALRCAPLAPPPPATAEVHAFCAKFLKLDLESTPHTTDGDVKEACHSSLRSVMMDRARKLWDHTEANSAKDAMGTIYVAWSGGIDSTAVLCVLLGAAQETVSADRGRLQRLKVVLDEESIAENPSFHENFISGGKLEQVSRQGQPLSWHEHRFRLENKANLFITGELGDQLFGSDRCKAAFLDEERDELPDDVAKKAPLGPPTEFHGVFVEKGLAAPWEETILPSLGSIGLMAEGGIQDWKEWIEPQLQLAPFPIVSTYEFLWWLNFSMKWQNVSLRCLHDGGEPLLSHTSNVAGLTGCIRHFYDYRDLECWSCVKAFHPFKFPDLADFTTYKEPLKYIIKQFDGNETYYSEKVKVPSLCFGAPEEANSYVNRFYGAVVDLLVPPAPEQSLSNGIANGCNSLNIDPLSPPKVLTWGSCGLSGSCSQSLEQLVHPQTLSAAKGYPNDRSDSIFVDPWKDSLLSTCPFNVAPFFAEEDERLRRVFNPVSKNTLVGKCASLLTSDILRDRSFLDLGACLGASTHWALCQGASQATAVEIQESFCQRAETMLKRAEGLRCWPDVRGQCFPRFQVVCSGIREYLTTCADASHDVVLAAGLLHCFVDPIPILLDMVRVASHVVLIEMTHPNVYLDGHLLDPDDNSKASGGLRRAVQPLQRRIEEGGLLQVAPRALVNMADNDASFVGLAILPSRMTIESTMKNLGFSVSRVFLQEHPTANDDVLTYTGPRRHRALSTRYFIRCVRRKTTNVPTHSLESLVRTNDRRRSTTWTKPPSWFTFGSTEPEPLKPPEIEENDHLTSLRTVIDEDTQAPSDDPEVQWEFDATVATRFQSEARCHIPDYEAVIDDSIHLLLQACARFSLDIETLKVVDVGCAAGHTLVKLLEQGFRNVHGVDISVPMLQQAAHETNAELHVSEAATDLPASLKIVDEKLGAVFVNWTLQFVPRDTDRKTFLRNIANGMQVGALLVLTEKTSQNPLTKTAYYEFKKSMGVSEHEIAVKEARLKGVLETFGVDWYLDALHECGFSEVTLFRARYGFVTFIARRSPTSTTRTVAERDQERIHQAGPVGKFKTWPNVSEAAKRVRYEAKEECARFQMRAWGISTESMWEGGSEEGTVYGYVYEGPTQLSTRSRSNGSEMSFTVHTGMYFACPGFVLVSGGSGLLQHVQEHRAMFAIGGPVEEGHGRLPYIDGCTDSLLLAPVIKGAPCLNYLHFPTGVVQTQHTHPSGRSGLVVRGQGTCVCDGGRIRMALEPGMAFVIPANYEHAFETTGAQELDVIAFHPDSDYGPSFDDHPMINRTIVDGISASRIQSIQTQQHCK